MQAIPSGSRCGPMLFFRSPARLENPNALKAEQNRGRLNLDDCSGSFGEGSIEPVRLL
jgi:hypothetical protein